MSAADRLLSRLEGVRPSGRGRWMARCSGHTDKRASLSVRETDDGRVLAHCFGGCGIDEVLAGAGLTLADLMPASAIGDNVRRERRPVSVVDLAHALRFELTVALVLLAGLRVGEVVTIEVKSRADVGVDRVLHFLGELDNAI